MVIYYCGVARALRLQRRGSWLPFYALILAGRPTREIGYRAKCQCSRGLLLVSAEDNGTRTEAKPSKTGTLELVSLRGKAIRRFTACIESAMFLAKSDLNDLSYLTDCRGPAHHLIDFDAPFPYNGCSMEFMAISFGGRLIICSEPL